jgi:hypothetical protein
MSNGETPKVNYGDATVMESNGYNVVIKPVFGDDKYYFHEVSIFNTEGHYTAHTIIWDYKEEDLGLYIVRAFNNRATSICEGLGLRSK